MAAVSGKVTYQGKPVPQGTVTFYPQAGGRPSIGHIESDGTYVLSSVKPGDGAALGEYRVAIEARKVTGAPAEPTSFQDELEGKFPAAAAAPKIEWLVPQEYSSAETSGLTATVEDKDNVIDFNLL